MPSSPPNPEAKPARGKTRGGLIRKILCANAILAVTLTAALVLYPAVRGALDTRDPALKGPGAANIEWRLMRYLTPRYARRAGQPAAAGRAGNPSNTNIFGAERAVFDCVCYLRAIENLQGVWQGGDHDGGVEPRIYCKNAIVAASERVLERRRGGTNQAGRDNLVYSTLVIEALTSRAELLHDGAHLDMLREQVETLAREIDRTKSGLWNEEAGRCHPCDVMAAIEAIRRADAALGTNHARMMARALRGFAGPGGKRPGLPPYIADAGSGAALSPARGWATAYICLTSPEMWPAAAKEWIELYEKEFWQERLGLAGFREFPQGYPKGERAMDGDSGPVIAGFGVAADVFGIGAARRNGRFDLAYPLSSELVATLWELPDGTLAGPLLFSRASGAATPDETAIFWMLSIQPRRGIPIKTGGSIPVLVYVVILGAMLLAIWRFDAGIDAYMKARREPEPEVVALGLQVLIWVGLIAGAMTAMCLGSAVVGLVLALAALVFPRTKKGQAEEEE
jgi:hypothetical protein